MTRNICIKMLIIFFAVTILLNVFCFQESYAVGDMLQAGQDFLGKGQGTSTVINETALSDASDKIYNLLLSIAIIIAVIVAMILGIQFMVASADEKAKVKEALMPFVVGCVVVFGSFTVWKVAVNIGNDAVGPITDATDAPAAPVLTWDKATSARDFIDKGGDLTDKAAVPNTVLYEWYGQLSRLAGNRGAMTEYYEKVYDECKNRGFFAEDGTVQTDVINGE